MYNYFGDFMYSIKNNIDNTIIIKKSKFITLLYKVNNIDEVENILEEIKNKYSDSTHICYAYIVSNHEKAFDDGEPSGTAGMPILNVLKKNNITNILAVVVRYFGGIKLGASGLLRAYSNSVSDALKLTSIIELTPGYLIEIEFTRDNLKLIDYMLTDKQIVEKIFNDNVIYKFYLNEEELYIISEFEKCCLHVSINDKFLIEKNEI